MFNQIKMHTNSWLQYLVSAVMILITLFFILRPAFHGGLFQSHDDVQVTRIQAMVEELRSGQFPVRYINSFGNYGGYFLFNFYSPLVYYLGAGLVFAGISSIAAVKVIYLVIAAIGTAGMFVLLRSRVSLLSTSFGTILFLLAPYVFHDFFHRGALPESTALVFLPWVLWAFLNLKKKPIMPMVALSALSFAAVVLSHILTAVLAGGLLLLLLVPLPPRKNIAAYLGAIALGLALSGFYFFPAVWESQFTQYKNSNLIATAYKDQFVELSAQVGSPQIVAEKSAFLGAGLVMAVALTVFGVMHKKSVKNDRELLVGITVAAVAGLFLVSPWSSLIWQQVVYLRYLQFPYRILTYLVVILPLGCAIVFDQLKNKVAKSLLVIAMVLVPTTLNLPYYQVSGYQYVAEYQAEGKCRTTAWEDEHLPIWVTECLPSGGWPLVASKSPGLIVNSVTATQNDRTILFTATGSAGIVEVGKYFFPGWQATTETGAALSVAPGTTHGLLLVSLPESTAGTTVTVKLADTPVRTWGSRATLIAALLLMGSMVVWLYQQYQSIGRKKTK